MAHINIHASDGVKVGEGGHISLNSSTLGIAVPDILNVTVYEKLEQVIVGEHPGEFIQAWHGIIYRLRAAIDAEELYANTSETDHETKYLRANNIFIYFTSALSAVECFSSGIYAIGAFLDSEKFSNPKPYPLDTKQALDDFDRDSELCKTLTCLLATSEYKELSDIRNYLSHNGSPSTKYRRGIGNAGGDGQSSTIRNHVLEYNHKTLQIRLNWLVGQINNLLLATEVFCKMHKLKYMD